MMTSENSIATIFRPFFRFWDPVTRLARRYHGVGSGRKSLSESSGDFGMVCSPYAGDAAFGAAKPTCDDLTEMADELDAISADFAKAGTIREGDPVDLALGELVGALILVAKVENEPAMTSAVNSLIDAYDKMDSEKFKLSLDSVIANMDRLYRRDCP